MEFLVVVDGDGLGHKFSSNCFLLSLKNLKKKVVVAWSLNFKLYQFEKKHQKIYAAKRADDVRLDVIYLPFLIFVQAISIHDIYGVVES